MAVSLADGCDMPGQSGQSLDHWITEYQNGDGRWARIDSEILGGTVLDHPGELRAPGSS